MTITNLASSNGRSKWKVLLTTLALCAGLSYAVAQDNIQRLPLKSCPAECMNDLSELYDTQSASGQRQSQATYAAPQTTQSVSKPQIKHIKNAVAEFAGIDKITGRIITFDIYVDETVQFGTLQVTPHVCYSRLESEEPKTDSFVEIDEITLDRKIRRIFTGWMFAESPGLNAVEHAVYDVWLKSCKQKSDVPTSQTAKTN